MNPINIAAGLVLGVVVGGLIAWVVVFIIHERREFKRQDALASDSIVRNKLHEEAAQYRERRAMERHDLAMLKMDHVQRTASGIASSQRYLDGRISDLERVVEDHAGHLEALGRAAARVKRSES